MMNQLFTDSAAILGDSTKAKYKHLSGLHRQISYYNKLGFYALADQQQKAFNRYCALDGTIHFAQVQSHNKAVQS